MVKTTAVGCINVKTLFTLRHIQCQKYFIVLNQFVNIYFSVVFYLNILV